MIDESENLRKTGLEFFQKGGTTNFQQAMNYFKRSADLNNADAMADIALMYQNGYFVKQDSDKAFHWLKKSADNGSVNGMLNFGLIMATQNNYDDALKWLDKAYNKSEGLMKGKIAYNISLVYKKISDDKSSWISNLISDEEDDDLKKSEEWLNISKKLNYEPPKTSNNDNSFDLGEVVAGIAEIILASRD